MHGLNVLLKSCFSVFFGGLVQHSLKEYILMIIVSVFPKCTAAKRFVRVSWKCSILHFTGNHIKFSHINKKTKIYFVVCFSQRLQVLLCAHCSIVSGVANFQITAGVRFRDSI